MSGTEAVILAFAAILLIQILRTKHEGGGSARDLLRREWGSRRPSPPSMDEIAIYHQLRQALEMDPAVDERTWSDLDMDEVFALLDRTSSAPGQQVLYDRLRSMAGSVEDLESLEQSIVRFAEDESLRTDLQLAMRPLRQSNARYLPYLFLAPLPDAVRFPIVYRLLTLALIVTALLVAVSPAFIFPAIAFAVTNFATNVWHRKRIETYIQPLRLLHSLVSVAKAVEIRLGEPLTGEAAAVQSLAPLSRTTAWLMFEREEANELARIVYQYVNMFLLLDVNAFVSSLSFVERHASTIRAVFEGIGRCDLAIAVASFRAGAPQYTRPQFIEAAKHLEADDLYHPLLTEPVANAVDIDVKGVLVTGSNMSGKTTFLRAIGVNAILAQSIHTVAASRYVAPWLAVSSSIGRGDSLMEGKSYYLAEVERIAELMKRSEGSAQQLFIIDEIFRGTNTTERIAASKAVLSYLNRGSALVIVATHDIELLNFLAGEFRFHHFRETVSGSELTFDYRLHPGPSSTRNAIALLELFDYPKSVVRDAVDIAMKLESR
jgi:DNA mismatch repair ATPase MutS